MADPILRPTREPPLLRSQIQQRPGHPLYLPALVYGFVILLLLTNRERWREPLGFRLSLVVLSGLAFFPYLYMRPDAAHLYPQLAPLAVLGVWLVSEVRGCRSRGFRLALSGAVLVLSVMFVARPLVAKANLLSDTFRYNELGLVPLSVPRGGGVRWETGPTYDATIHYVRARTAPGEKIFVGNERHDRINVNDALFYFLAERHSATKYHELHPGLATTTAIQARIIADLEKHAVRWIILRRSDDFDEKSPREMGELDAFIRRHFRPIVMFGRYTVWNRERL